ncbi:MAG: hypothetical protein M0Z30_08195 [Actinomycetota bacterium]|nr:hypothetical protein [Actinomycetota bacterium]
MSGDHLVVAVPLAVAAAACSAGANVLQSRAVRVDPPSGRVDLRILGRLATRRMWLAGLAVSVVGFGCQAVALGPLPGTRCEGTPSVIGRAWILGIIGR